MRLELQHIHKQFGDKQVLRDVSLTACGGQAFGLLGRNGAGKTTTIRILMGVFPADDGSVLIDGQPIDYTRVKLGYLPEERGLYPKKPIFDQLTYFARLQGLSRADAARAVDRWLARLGMSEYRNRRLDTLSKGNQQKIQLITALAHDPDIIVLDEPFSGLDPVNAMLLKDVVREEISRGKIVLFSSHQMNYIEEFCDSIAILKDGEIAIAGALAQLKRSYPRDRLMVRGDAERILAAGDFAAALTEKGDVTITLSDPAEKGAVMQKLTAAFDIDEVRVFEPTLNDIFVQYAGGGDRA